MKSRKRHFHRLCAILSCAAFFITKISLTATTSAAAEGGSAAGGPAVELAEGRSLFRLHCSSCHGPGGEGAKGPTLAQVDLPRANTPDILVRIIAEGIPGTEMPPSRLTPQQIQSVAAFVKALGTVPAQQVAGNPERGSELYRTKGGCALCHAIRGHGGAIGPDLTSVGRSRSASHLRRALLDPGADVPMGYGAYRGEVGLPRNFLFVRARTRTGAEIGGVRLNEDTVSIQIRDLTGQVHSFPKADLLELHKDWNFSPMPSYAEVFSSTELDDVVSYLVSLRGGAK